MRDRAVTHSHLVKLARVGYLQTAELQLRLEQLSDIQLERMLDIMLKAPGNLGPQDTIHSALSTVERMTPDA